MNNFIILRVTGQIFQRLSNSPSVLTNVNVIFTTYLKSHMCLVLFLKFLEYPIGSCI